MKSNGDAFGDTEDILENRIFKHQINMLPV